MEIFPGIHRVETDFGGRANAVFVLVGSRRTLLVDTATRDVLSDLQPYLERIGVDRIDLVVNTHADVDHIGGNDAVAHRYPGALLMCHRFDQHWIEDASLLVEERYDEYAQLGMPESAADKRAAEAIAGVRSMDLALVGGERIALGGEWEVEVLHLPGHSHGHVGLHDPRSASVIVGDAVLGDGLYFKDGSPAFPPTYRYVADYRRSIREIRGLGQVTLLTAHYEPMTPDRATGFLDATEKFVDDLAAAVEAELRAHADGMDFADLVRAVVGTVGPWTGPAQAPLKFPVLGHLEELQDRGLVTGTDGRYRWSAS